MADRKTRDVVRPNVIDGIEEYDNPLPSWWVWLFNACIVFGVLYFIWFHIMGKPGLEDELAQDRVAFQKATLEMNQQAAAGGEDLAVRIKDPKLVAEGKAIFATNCSPCHGQMGEGTVGPNLTDKFWIHGGGVENVKGSVTDGIPAKGMIAWGSILGAQKIESVVGYVMSLQDTNPPNGKAPEGEEQK